jgi:hypothetical protein
MVNLIDVGNFAVDMFTKPVDTITKYIEKKGGTRLAVYILLLTVVVAFFAILATALLSVGDTMPSGGESRMIAGWVFLAITGLTLLIGGVVIQQKAKSLAIAVSQPLNGSSPGTSQGGRLRGGYY